MNKCPISTQSPAGASKDVYALCSWVYGVSTVAKIMWRVGSDTAEKQLCQYSCTTCTITPRDLLRAPNNTSGTSTDLFSNFIAIAWKRVLTAHEIWFTNRSKLLHHASQNI
jgi:hypothetical protein